MRSLLFPLALLLPTGAAAAPAPVVALEALPPTVVLDRPQTRQPVLVLGRRADGTQEDLTRFARYRMAGDGVAGVSRTGEVFPLRNGETYLDVRAPGRTTVRLRVSVQVRNAGPRYRWDFATHIAPLLTRAGCNGTGCHGNVLGRGGFRLAAFGHDPEWDYSSLVRAGGGRRVFRQNPGASLLLLKATLAVPHGGGRRFAVDSPEYRTFAAWIADGAPRGESGSDVRRIQILPEQRLLSRPRERQRLLVRAWYGDGTREDVTHLALLESRNTGVVEVEAAELVAAGLGETRLLARFAGRTALAQVAATSLGPLRTRIGYDPANPVDREVLGRLLRLGLAPAPPAADGEWLRKVYLDLIGRIPTAEELDAFLAETDPQKRQRVVDHLLA
ncbi:MAG: DUF1549 domain-containing protein, partial [Armatimonadetes bacterium]|nr:DUF1549 domain-containing protein [Armatimonadota bacterium]